MRAQALVIVFAEQVAMPTNKPLHPILRSGASRRPSAGFGLTLVWGSYVHSSKQGGPMTRCLGRRFGARFGRFYASSSELV